MCDSSKRKIPPSPPFTKGGEKLAHFAKSRATPVQMGLLVFPLCKRGIEGNLIFDMRNIRE